jgi:Flp pilus assembly pilin Flp
MRKTTQEADMAHVTGRHPRPTAWRRLASDQTGQELIEYGLLIVTIGLAGALLFPIIEGKLSTGFSANDSAIQRDWSPCDPGAFPC